MCRPPWLLAANRPLAPSGGNSHQDPAAETALPAVVLRSNLDCGSSIQKEVYGSSLYILMCSRLPQVVCSNRPTLFSVHYLGVTAATRPLCLFAAVYLQSSDTRSARDAGGAEREVAAARAQLRSANRFVNMDTMHEWIFVAPRGHMGTLVAFLDRALQTLPGLPASKVGAAAISATGAWNGVPSCNNWLVHLLPRSLQCKQPARQ